MNTLKWFEDYSQAEHYGFSHDVILDLKEKTRNAIIQQENQINSLLEENKQLKSQIETLKSHLVLNAKPFIGGDR